jgi:hypothetical protein
MRNNVNDRSRTMIITARKKVLIPRGRRKIRKITSDEPMAMVEEILAALLSLSKIDNTANHPNVNKINISSNINP